MVMVECRLQIVDSGVGLQEHSSEASRVRRSRGCAPSQLCSET